MPPIQVGWRDIEEYRSEHGEPERWEGSMLVAKIKSKGSGCWAYFGKERGKEEGWCVGQRRRVMAFVYAIAPFAECEDKWVPRVKLFVYE